MSDIPPTRSVRFVTRALLVAMLIVGFTSAEAWPLTSFHLFSHERSRIAQQFVVAAVDATGRESEVRFLDLPMEFHTTDLQIKEFAGWSVPHRDGVCDAWIAAMRVNPSTPQLHGVVWLRIEQVSADLVTGRRVRSTVSYECGSQRPKRGVQARQQRHP